MASGTQTEPPKLSEPPFLADAGALAQFCEALPQNEPCALDTEADSLHCHREKLCLIQFSCAGQHALIDPLAIDDLDPLHRYLEGAEIWMHGADYDMSIWKRTFDSVPERIFDTQTAARMLGFRAFGLAPLVEELFGVKLCKASQKAD